MAKFNIEDFRTQVRTKLNPETTQLQPVTTKITPTVTSIAPSAATKAEPVSRPAKFDINQFRTQVKTILDTAHTQADVRPLSNPLVEQTQVSLEKYRQPLEGITPESINEAVNLVKSVPKSGFEKNFPKTAQALEYMGAGYEGLVDLINAMVTSQTGEYLKTGELKAGTRPEVELPSFFTNTTAGRIINSFLLEGKDYISTGGVLMSAAMFATPGGKSEKIAQVASKEAIAATEKGVTGALKGATKAVTKVLSEEAETILTNTGKLARTTTDDLARIAEEQGITISEKASRNEIVQSLKELKASYLKETVPVENIAKEPSKIAQNVDVKKIIGNLEKRGISGDKLLDAEDLANDLIEKGGIVDSDGMVTLYHRTTNENAQQIIKTGNMIGKEDSLYFGTSPVGQIEGYGDTVIKVQLPLEKLNLDDVFANEAHVTLKGNKATVKAELWTTKVEIPKVETPITQVGTPPIKPPDNIPKVATGAGLEPPKPPVGKKLSTINPDDAIKKIIPAIKDAKPYREITEQLKHEELSKRAAVFASILKGGEGYRAFEKAKGALQGTLPQADFMLDLPKFGITEEDIISLFEKIRLADMQPFQKLNTYEALNKFILGQLPTEGELIRLEKMFGSEFVEAIMSKMTTKQKVIHNLLDIANIPRTLVTIGDFSATLRQGLVLSAGQPVQFSKSLANEMKAVFSEKNAKLIDDIISNRHYADLGEQSGLYIAPRGAAGSVLGREEAFMSRLIKKIPVLGQVVGASERAYVTFLNTLRSEVFDYYARAWEGTGKSVADYKDLASFINHATGRGGLGVFERAGAVLNVGFFSPRFAVSRVQVPLDLFTSTPAVRKVVARNLVSLVGAGTTALTLAALAGAEVETDPRSADFGKIKIGNTRIDFWAGFLPYARAITQLATGQRKVTATGDIIELNREDVITNFIRSKESPFVGLIHDIIRGETFIGEELTLKSEDLKQQAYERLVPMFAQDIVDAMNDSGMVGIGLGLPSALGVGVQTYADNWNSEESKLGLPVRMDVPPYTIEKEVYDVTDYYSKVGSYIGGATSAMLTDKKNVPDKVRSVAEAKDVKRITEVKPGTPLYQIDSDSLDKYKIDKRISQNEYVLLKQYNSLETQKEKDAFLKEHSELSVNPREDYLIKNPKENAKLALWGQAKVYTKEAYDQVINMAKELDIPYNALVGLPSEQISEQYFTVKDSRRDEMLKGDMTSELADKWVEYCNLYDEKPTYAYNYRDDNPDLYQWGIDIGIWKELETATSSSTSRSSLTIR
jgi:hypothetical protein